MSLTNPHNTTSGDNSSDSASNKKNSCRTELEIIESKLKKCTNEIESMKKKVQREWSLQMNNHLKNFYPEEEKNKSDMFSSPISQTSSHNESPADIEKQIRLLQKKLSSYERRKQKIIQEQAKANESQDPAGELLNDTSSSLNATLSTSSNPSDILSSNQSNNSSIITTTSANTAVNSSVISNGNNPTETLNNPGNIQITPNTTLSVNNRNVSFNNNGKLEFLASFQTELTNSNNLNEENKNVSSQEANVYGQGSGQMGMLTSGVNAMTSSINSNNSVLRNNTSHPSSSNLAYINGNVDGIAFVTNEELLTSNANILATNKSLQNMIFLQAEQIYYLKLQQENIQSSLDDMQRKMEENHQTLLKELQHSYSQISEPIHKLSFNLFKSYDQKLDDFKSASLTSMQSLGYNLTHYQRDIKEIKEDTIFMKNRVEIIEKTQKTGAVDSNLNKNQLFYKVLDIFLTLATIILLAFTKLIASIQFVFLLYPRSIVIFIFMYFFFYYLVDLDKLADLHYTLSSDPENLQFNSLVGANLQETFFKRTWLALYRAFYSSKPTVT